MTGGTLLPIEVEATSRPRREEAADLRTFRAEHGEPARAGLRPRTGRVLVRLDRPASEGRGGHAAPPFAPPALAGETGPRAGYLIPISWTRCCAPSTSVMTHSM